MCVSFRTARGFNSPHLHTKNPERGFCHGDGESQLLGFRGEVKAGSIHVSGTEAGSRHFLIRENSCDQRPCLHKKTPPHS